MIFLNSVLLGLLAAAGIPLLIHLLNPRQRRRQPISTLRFLKAIQSTRLRRLTVRRWLLLALRTLIVILLVLAFARPAVKGNLLPGAGHEAMNAVLLFDNSVSVRGVDDRQQAFSQQLSALRILLEAGTAKDRYSLLLLARPVRWLTPVPVGREELLPMLKEVTPAWSTDDLSGALDLARERLGEGGLLRELHVFSDGRLFLEGDSLVQALPTPLSAYRHASISSENDRVLPRQVVANTLILKEAVPVEVECRLVLPERDPGGGLTLEAGGVPLAHREREPGENPALLRFNAPPAGEHGLTLRIGGPESGELGLCRTVLSVPERIPVLLAGEAGPALEATAAALRPGGAYERSISLTRVRLADLERENLVSYRMVVVLGPDRLSAGARNTLAQAVEQGLGLVLMPGAGEPDVAAFGRFTQELGLPGVAGVRGPGTWRTERPDLEHPLFRGMLEPGREPDSPEIRRVLQLVGGDSLRTVITLGDGTPLLLEHRRGYGRVLLLASAPEDGWSSLAHSGLFPALVNRLCYYLARSADAGAANLVCGVSARLQGLALPVGGLELAGPDGPRTLPPAGRGGLVLPALDTPGFYHLVSQGDTLRTLAVNPDFDDLVRPVLATEELERWTGTSFETPPADLHGFGNTRRGREIWRPLLVAAALLLALELLLGQGRERANKEMDT